MRGTWELTIDYIMYIEIIRTQIKITCSVHDVYNKECFQSEITSHKFWFMYNGHRYTLIKKYNVFAIFEEYNLVTQNYKKIIAKKVSDNLLGAIEVRKDRRKLLDEEYKRTSLKIPNFIFEHDEKACMELIKRTKLNNWVNREDSLSTLLSIRKWVSHNFCHKGNIQLPIDKSAISLIKYSEQTNKSLNCRALSIILCELCLAAGFKSRYIACMPKEIKISDCHVVVSTYIPELSKWIMLDPSYDTCVYSKLGEPLGIEEIRNSIKNNEEVLIENSCYHGEKLSFELYIRALTKNIYRFSQPINMKIGGTNLRFIDLVPDIEEYKDLECIDNPEFFWI